MYPTCRRSKNRNPSEFHWKGRAGREMKFDLYNFKLNEDINSEMLGIINTLFST